jgi:hypothetical protein
VENDLTIEHLSWCDTTPEDIGEEQKAQAREILDIYAWWITYKIKFKLNEARWDEACTDGEYKEIMEEADRIQEPMTSYLHRLIDVRKSVWS